MSSDTDISRRGFVATQVAGAAVVAALPATGASAATGLLTTTESAPAAGPFNWLSSGSAKLKAHIGRRFRFQTEDGRSAVLKLVAVEPVLMEPVTVTLRFQQMTMIILLVSIRLICSLKIS